MALNTQFAVNNIYFVDGEQQAKTYPVAYGASVVFLDRNEDKMYIKSVDQSGVMTAFRKFLLEEEIAMPAGDFVSKAQYEELQGQLNEIKEMLKNQHNEPQNNNKRYNNRNR